MFISYIYISFINIKTCDKYDASSSVNDQIKNLYFNGGGGGGRKYKNYLYSRPFWTEKIQKLYFHDHGFLEGGGGGGGGGVGRKRGKIKF